jgi:hypothetical protein
VHLHAKKHKHFITEQSIDHQSTKSNPCLLTTVESITAFINRPGTK